MTTVGRDPGLQPERTNLAWSRTALRLILTATALLGWSVGEHLVTALAAGVLALTGVAIYLTQGRRYRRHVRGLAEGAVGPATLGVAVLGVCGTALGVLCFLLVLTGVLR